MPLRIAISDSGFAESFDALVNARREADADVSADVKAIIQDVRDHGDEALLRLTSKFDQHDLEQTGWRVDKTESAAALEGLEASLRVALELAALRIRDYHEGQVPDNRDYIDEAGVRIGARWNAVERAGIYIPGGRAAYPSSVLMNAIPAKAAGVDHLVMVTPAPGGEINPLVLAAAELAGVDEIWRIGGAQAVAALAYGTENIAPVDVVTGPGNAWVAEAKRQVFGVVGIDMVAGPSEIVVVADGKNNPDWIAADLLSQAEHDPTSQSILFTNDSEFADQVSEKINEQLMSFATSATATTSWDDNGAIIVLDRLEQAVPLVDRLAAEHLELAIDDPDGLFRKVRHAGSVFLGRHTPEAIGDYIAGPNHVLPTGRRARFSSGLSVTDFMKRTSFIHCDDQALRNIGPAAVALAEAEGLPAHAASIQKRLDRS
ncbi:MAG: histidinol dehydrogenase [Parasphingorhabdus sp.]|uniref:histidinol dehydrogenase n=1 Tax=Parasphingorhabdus sp. TaxID=2709688 RepID=UPI0032636C42